MVNFLKTKILHKINIMKSNKEIRTLMGLSHREMAAVLGVSISQWSMYQSGQRNLPLHATQLLAELLTHLNAQAIAQKPSQNNEAQRIRRQHLEALLRENQYQRLVLDKKMAAAAKKAAARAQSALIADYLAKRPMDKSGKTLRLLRGHVPFDEALKIEIDLDVKRELLAHENRILESKLLEITARPENPGDAAR